jgi:hypothetical protein
MDSLQIENEQYKVEFRKVNIVTGSSNDVHNYMVSYNFAEDKELTSSLEIICKINENQNNCVIHASFIAINLNEHSAFILNDSVFLAIGNEVCKFQLPNLALIWRTKSDTSVCFGLYPSSEQDYIIVHGECEISRLNLMGKIEWQASGKDIFTEGFEIFSTQIEVIDFNFEKYRIDLSSGNIALQKGG